MTKHIFKLENDNEIDNETDVSTSEVEAMVELTDIEIDQVAGGWGGGASGESC